MLTGPTPEEEAAMKEAAEKEAEAKKGKGKGKGKGKDAKGAKGKGKGKGKGKSDEPPEPIVPPPLRGATEFTKTVCRRFHLQPESFLCLR